MTLFVVVEGSQVMIDTAVARGPVRQFQDRARARARARFQFEFTAIRMGGQPHEKQAQAHAFARGLGREKRLAGAAQDLFRHP